MDLRARLGAVLRDLARTTAETALLTVYDEAAAARSASTASRPHGLRLTIEIGRVTPIHAGASAKALLAFLEQPIIDEVLSHEKLEALAPGTVTDPDVLRKQLEQIRKRGWASSCEENNAGAWGLAAPIIAGGRVVASIGFAAPTARHSNSAVRSRDARLRGRARVRVEARFGGRGLRVARPETSRPRAASFGLGFADASQRREERWARSVITRFPWTASSPAPTTRWTGPSPTGSRPLWSTRRCRGSARSLPAAAGMSWRSSDGTESTGSTEGPTRGTCSFSPTTRPRTARTGSRFTSDGIENAVATAQAAAGDGDVGIFGGALTRQCLQAGLLDEIVLHVAPVLLGGGIRLFGDEGSGRIELERMSVGEAEQLTDLQFRVVNRRSA